MSRARPARSPSSSATATSSASYGAVVAPQEDDRARGAREEADRHTEAPAHAEARCRERVWIDLEHAGRALAHDALDRRLADEAGHAGLGQRRRVAERRVRGRDVSTGAVRGEHVDDAHVAQQRQRDPGEAAEDLLVVERHPEHPGRLGQQVEPPLGGLGPVERGPLGVEQAAALHRARAEPRDRPDERLTVGGDRVGVIPGEAEDAEQGAVRLQRHGRDRAWQRRDAEPLERRRVAAHVLGRVLDEHRLAGARDVRRRERQVEGQPGHRPGAVVRVAPRGDRPQLRFAGLDEEHHGAVRTQRGDPARHERFGDLGRRQGARELRGERLERLEASGGEATVALAERRPSERVRGDGRDGRERRSEAGGQPPRDGLPSRLHRPEMVLPGGPVSVLGRVRDRHRSAADGQRRNPA